MNTDIKWFCMAALPRDWIWILMYSTEAVLETATCNYTRDNVKNSLLTGFHQQNDTGYHAQYIPDPKSRNPLLKL